MRPTDIRLFRPSLRTVFIMMTAVGVIAVPTLVSSAAGFQAHRSSVSSRSAAPSAATRSIAGSVAGRIRLYPDAGYSPRAIVAGPDGALWFTETDRQGNTKSIGRITTAGVISHFTDPQFSDLGALAAGPDGALWFVDNGFMQNGQLSPAVGRITTAGAVTFFPDPSHGANALGGIAAGPDGAMWYQACCYSGSFGNISGSFFAIDRITTTGALTTFADPRIKQCVCRYGHGIVAGPDGALWFVNDHNDNSGSIGRITTGGTIAIYTKPGVAAPAAIVRGPDGALWFGSGVATGLWRITTAGVITRYENQTLVGALAAGPDGGVWVSTLGDWIQRITTATGAVATYALGDVTTAGIAAGRDGAIWFTEESSSGGAIGRFALGLKLVRAPTLSGAHQPGKREAVSSGVWSPSATSYSYRWYLGSRKVAHAISSRYRPPVKDMGKKLHCVVTAHRAGYANSSAATRSVTLT